MPLASSVPPPQNLKHRVFTCLNKLSDRDTYGVASVELESIARDLEPSSLGAFISCIHTTDASDKSPVRKQCVRLLAVLSESHGDSLAPHLTKILSGFLSSEDWAARKAAAEALVKLAVLERDALSDFKAGCLRTFENRRFDKVKVVREVMSQMLEAWKQIPDVSGDVSPPPHSQASSKENASDGRYPPGSRNSGAVGSEALHLRKKSGAVGSEALHLRKKSILASRSTPPDSSYATTARKRTPHKGSDKKASPSMFQKKKPLNWKVEIAVPNAASQKKVLEDDYDERDENDPKRRINEKANLSKPETKRALFHKNSEDKGHKFGGFRSGSRVVPYQEESKNSTVLVSNVSEDIHKNHIECEDLSSIRHQLVQIEKQQSSLLDLLQRFIGSSQNGMRSLETRVHGLELALDEISYDLAVSTGRMSKTDSSRTTCCMLPGADFLSSKFWRKTEGRLSAPRISTSSGTPSVAAMRYRDDANGSAERFKLNRRFRLQGGGFIVNPLAEIQSDSRGNTEVVHQ
ncbi:hypothetical protein L484_008927 [Morus notabilis]|uniref:TORTIFOLIA1/SINE1-2 N-terminal domain-containing protein n=1 Tax=Morus notabilis TaxID=981085 RepID=W9QNR5_9ROSA|nr:hypothetical protein L484_008927 [Morus notabilis]